jgi:hypothetical protein
MPAAVNIMSTQVSFFHHNVDVMTLDQLRMAEAAQGRYLPPVKLESPDGPVLAMVSENAHSQIFFTPASVALHVQYSVKWRSDPSLGKAYVLERLPLLFDLISAYPSRTVIYAGCTVEAQISTDLPDQDILDAIREEFGGAYGADLSDLTIRTSTIVDNMHYRNLSVRNFRQFEAGPQTPPQIRLKNADAAMRGVEVLVDYNSRHGYNEGHTVSVTTDTVAHLIEAGFETAVTISTNVAERLP